MTNWNDFNDADHQAGFDLIPKGTLLKVRMTLKPGGVDNPAQGWSGGWATAAETGSVYLNAEFVVLAGDFAKRKLWSRIGLHSPKGPEWAAMGRAFIRAALNSARGVDPKDDSDQAHTARRIVHFGDLDGLVFIARVDLEKGRRGGEDRNTIQRAIEPDHKDYTVLMGAAMHTPTASAPVAGHAPAVSTVPSNKPAWAS
jgi:hypothetical protein